MRSLRSPFALLATLTLAVSACGGADEGAEADAEMDMPEASAEASLTAAEVTAAVEGLECFLNNATMEEAEGRPSPLHQEPIVLGRDVGKVCYGAPSRRDRVIMGDLVPYGALWRAGANEATTLHLPFAAQIGSVAVQPGSYSLFMRPAEDQWEVFVSPMYERWGIPITDEVQQSALGSFMVTPVESDEMVEVMEYRWEAQGPDQGTLTLAWENTEVPIPVSRPAM